MTLWSIVVNGVTYTNIYNCEAYFSEDSIDYFDFVAVENFALDTPVEVYFHGEKVLEGYITEKEEDGVVYKYRVYEKAIELAGQLVDYNGKYRDTWINLSVDAIVERILTNSNWKRDVDSSDTTVIPSVTYEYMTKLDALFKLFKEIRGTYVWFGAAYAEITESLAEGVYYLSTDTPITFNLSNTPIRPGTVEIFFSYYEPALGYRVSTWSPPDDGNGGISFSSPYSGTTVFSGTIDYNTGTLTITTIDPTYDPVEFIGTKYIAWYPKCVRYTDSRGANTIDDTYVVRVTKKDKSATDKPSKIVVLGAGDGINQVVAERGTGTPVKVFVYKDLKTQEEVDSVADKLYNELVTNATQEVSAIIKAPYVTPVMSTFMPGYQVSSNKLGLGYVKELKLTNVIEITLGKQKPTVGKEVKKKFRGIEPQSYFAQGVTNVANFGGWETAIDANHPATYNFFLPDSSVGTVKVNECYINVYGRPYRIWSRAVGTASMKQSETTVQSTGVVVTLSSGAWSSIASHTINVDTHFVLISIVGGITTDLSSAGLGYSFYKFRVSDGVNSYPDANGVVCEYVVSAGSTHDHPFSWSGSHNHYTQIDATTDATGMDVVYLASNSQLYYAAYDLTGLYSVATTSTTLNVSGTTSTPSLAFAQMVSKTILLPGNFNGKTLNLEVYPMDSGEYWFYYEIYAVGTHTHEVDTVAGIMEVATYPSNVEILVNGTSVATIAGNSSAAWSQEKIDITPYVQPGKNTIEVRSATLGNICVEGFYRIFIETSK